MLHSLSRLRVADGGSTAAEYALLAALIAVAIIGAVTAFGVSVEELFTDDSLLNALSS